MNIKYGTFFLFLFAIVSPSIARAAFVSAAYDFSTGGAFAADMSTGKQVLSYITNLSDGGGVSFTATLKISGFASAGSSSDVVRHAGSGAPGIGVANNTFNNGEAFKFEISISSPVGGTVTSTSIAAYF